MKNFAFLIALALAFGSAPSFAQLSNTCLIPKIDGDKVPFPLKTANSKFELAENETYLLNGYIVMNGGVSYFKIDFETQPWLATQQRLLNPYFAVNADLTMVKQYGGSLVEVAVVVRKQVGSPFIMDMLGKPRTMRSAIRSAY